MEGVWVALIGLASAAFVKLLDWIFSRKDRKDTKLQSIEDKIDQLQADQKQLREDVLENQALQCRQRILRFSDDLVHGNDHSKEYYDAVLQDITEYDLFCSEHKDFRNSVTSSAAKNILKNYDTHMWQKDFL